MIKFGESSTSLSKLSEKECLRHLLCTFPSYTPVKYEIDSLENRFEEDRKLPLSKSNQNDGKKAHLKPDGSKIATSKNISNNPTRHTISKEFLKEYIEK